MLIHITGSKSGLRDDLRRYDTKAIILRPFLAFLAKRLLATPNIPGDQKLFERVYYMLKLKVTKFRLPRPNGF